MPSGRKREPDYTPISPEGNSFFFLLVIVALAIVVILVVTSECNGFERLIR